MLCVILIIDTKHCLLDFFSAVNMSVSFRILYQTNADNVICMIVFAGLLLRKTPPPVAITTVLAPAKQPVEPLLPVVSLAEQALHSDQLLWSTQSTHYQELPQARSV